tara:strand:+ start:2249 stop:2479 length:231 start_codon:yes stop_codon:yes gene_type:complete
MSCLTNNLLINDNSLDNKLDKKNVALSINKNPKKSKKKYKNLMAELTKSSCDENTKDEKIIRSGLGGGQFSKIDKI